MTHSRAGAVFRRLALALVAMLVTYALAGAQALHGSPIVAGATADVTVSSQINTLWRKVQGKLIQGFDFECQEWDGLAAMSNYEVDYSTREITVPIDLDEDGGVGAVQEGGWETFPTSPAPDEITLNFRHFMGRFSVAGLTQKIEQNNGKALVQSQIAYQARKKMQAMAKWFSDSFYGYSTGVRAVVSGSYSAGTTQTLTLTCGYGNSSITDGTYITRMFVPNRDRVALIRAGAIVAGGTVTAKSASASTITVTFYSSITPAANDQVVLANQMFDGAAPTLNETDYNQGLVGLLEAGLATSVHGVSSSTTPEWKASLIDAGGGRFTGIRWHKGNDLVEDNGGGRLSVLYMSKGVYRDMLDNARGVLKLTDAFMLEMDGKVKIEGVEFRKRKRVPPGFVIGHDPKSYRKFPDLIAKPNGTPKWNEAEKFQDRDAWKHRLEFITALAVLNRANWAIWSGLTEQ